MTIKIYGTSMDPHFSHVVVEIEKQYIDDRILSTY